MTTVLAIATSTPGPGEAVRSAAAKDLIIQELYSEYVGLRNAIEANENGDVTFQQANAIEALNNNLNQRLEELGISRRNISLVDHDWPDPYFNPRELGSIVRKEKYSAIELLQGHESFINCLQALPDGRIVSGSADKTLRIWTKESDRWGSEVLEPHAVDCLHVVDDGRIISGSSDGTLQIWTKEAHGGWNSEKIYTHLGVIRCLQALPDGRIVSGSSDRTLRIWTKGSDSWSSEVLQGHTDWVTCLQVLPDGRIVTGSVDKTIRIWDGEKI